MSAPAVVDNPEGLEPEGAVDEADEINKDLDMEGEDEAEELSQRDEEEQANGEEPAEADDEPADPDAKIDGKKTRTRTLMLPRLKMDKKTKTTLTKEKSMKRALLRNLVAFHEGLDCVVESEITRILIVRDLGQEIRAVEQRNDTHPTTTRFSGFI